MSATSDAAAADIVAALAGVADPQSQILCWKAIEAAEEPYWSGSGIPNTHNESFSLAPAAIAADLQALVEGTYGDGWWAHRPATAHVLFEVDAAGAVHLRINATGPEDVYSGTFAGPGAGLTLGAYRLPLVRGSTARAKGRIRVSDPNAFAGGGQWGRPLILLSGYHVGSGNRSFVGCTLECNTGNKWIRGVYSRSGAGGVFAQVVTPDDTYYTTGTEFELIVASDHTISFRYRKSGAAVWIDSTAAYIGYGFVPAALYYVIGHGSSGLCDIYIDRLGYQVL